MFPTLARSMALTPKAKRAAAGVSKLNTILEHIRRKPAPGLLNVKSLHLEYAMSNNHFGARHFAKGELVALAYHNPYLKATRRTIPPKKYKRKEIGNNYGAFLTVHFSNASQVKIPIAHMQSPQILRKLLEIAGRAGHNNKKKPPTVAEAAAMQEKLDAMLEPAVKWIAARSKQPIDVVRSRISTYKGPVKRTTLVAKKVPVKVVLGKKGVTKGRVKAKKVTKVSTAAATATKVSATAATATARVPATKGTVKAVTKGRTKVSNAIATAARVKAKKDAVAAKKSTQSKPAPVATKTAQSPKPKGAAAVAATSKPKVSTSPKASKQATPSSSNAKQTPKSPSSTGKPTPKSPSRATATAKPSPKSTAGKKVAAKPATVASKSAAKSSKPKVGGPTPKKIVSTKPAAKVAKSIPTHLLKSSPKASAPSTRS